MKIRRVILGAVSAQGLIELASPYRLPVGPFHPFDVFIQQHLFFWKIRYEIFTKELLWCYFFPSFPPSKRLFGLEGEGRRRDLVLRSSIRSYIPVGLG